MELWNDMKKKRIALHILIVLFVFLSSLSAIAQEQNTDPVMPGESPKPTKYVALEEEKEHLVFFQGFTLSADVFGPISLMVSDYGTLEGALRLNLKNTYLPIVEAGYGQCDKTDFNTSVSYKVKAPFMRVGIDLNLLKDKFQDNRLYLGVRYGFSSYQYDIAGPAMTDPVWGGSEPFNFKGIDCTSHWGEVIFGAEVKIYKNFHMGWMIRYKKEFSSTTSDYAKPSCIPGYGYTTNSTCWGGTYSLIFDLNWGKKKSHKRGVKVEIRDIPQQDENVDGIEQEDEEKIEKEGETDNGERTGNTEKVSTGEANTDI